MSDLILSENNFGDKIYGRFPAKYREDDLNQNQALYRYIQSLSDGGFSEVIKDINNLLNFLDYSNAPQSVLPIALKQYGINFEGLENVPVKYLKRVYKAIGELVNSRGCLKALEYFLCVVFDVDAIGVDPREIQNFKPALYFTIYDVIRRTPRGSGWVKYPYEAEIGSPFKISAILQSVEEVGNEYEAMEFSSYTQKLVSLFVPYIFNIDYYLCYRYKEITQVEGDENFNEYIFERLNTLYFDGNHYIDTNQTMNQDSSISITFTPQNDMVYLFGDKNNLTMDIPFANISEINVFKDETDSGKYKCNLGCDIILLGKSEGGIGPIQFYYAYKKSEDSTYTQLRGWSNSDYYVFSPEETGEYVFRIRARDTYDNSNIKDIYFTVIVNDYTYPTHPYNLSKINTDSVAKGGKFYLLGSADNGTPPYTYTYQFKRSSNTEWHTSNSSIITPTAADSYDFRIIVTDANSNTMIMEFDNCICYEKNNFNFNYSVRSIQGTYGDTLKSLVTAQVNLNDNHTVKMSVNGVEVDGNELITAYGTTEFNAENSLLIGAIRNRENTGLFSKLFKGYISEIKIGSTTYTPYKVNGKPCFLNRESVDLIDSVMWLKSKEEYTND